MKIKEIKLRNFRVYSGLDLSIEGDLVFFIGPNGSGKTSVLEALHLASVLRSFRKGSDADFIAWGQTFYAATISLSSLAGEKSIHLAYGRPDNHEQGSVGRRLSVNREKISRLADFMGRLQTVVFSPDDMDIIDTTPAERRRFVDMILASLQPAYLESLQQYKKALQLRSALLKKSNDRLLFASLDQELARHGSLVQNQRQRFLAEFEAPFRHYVSLISDQKDDWRISYQPSVAFGETGEISAKEYQMALEAALPLDLRLRQTSKGVHRDKIVFSPPQDSQRDLQLVASQGQKRTVVLALRMAQFQYAREHIHENPVVLIDDVLNELDLERRSRFIEFLGEIGQAFVTTTDLSGMEEFIRKQRQRTGVEIYRLAQQAGQTVLLKQASEA